MGIRIKAEMRKISGRRFARFKLLDDVDRDSREEALISSAMRECNITSSDYTGVFKVVVRTEDGGSISRIGGVDIPAVAIKDFTTALSSKGFELV